MNPVYIPGRGIVSLEDGTANLARELVYQVEMRRRAGHTADAEMTTRVLYRLIDERATMIAPEPESVRQLATA